MRVTCETTSTPSARRKARRTPPPATRGAVALELHASAAAMAELASRHVAVEVVWVERDAGGQTLDDARQPRSVGLARGDQANAHGAGILSDRAAAGALWAGGGARVSRLR